MLEKLPCNYLILSNINFFYFLLITLTIVSRLIVNYRIINLRDDKLRIRNVDNFLFFSRMETRFLCHFALLLISVHCATADERESKENERQLEEEITTQSTAAVATTESFR